MGDALGIVNRVVAEEIAAEGGRGETGAAELVLCVLGELVLSGESASESARLASSAWRPAALLLAVGTALAGEVLDVVVEDPMDEERVETTVSSGSAAGFICCDWSAGRGDAGASAIGAAGEAVAVLPTTKLEVLAVGSTGDEETTTEFDGGDTAEYCGSAYAVVSGAPEDVVLITEAALFCAFDCKLIIVALSGKPSGVANIVSLLCAVLFEASFE